MAKKKKSRQPQKQKHTKSRALYVIAAVVILIPLLLLGYIYLDAKENKGSPTVGDRFDNELTTKISDSDIEKVKDALKFDQAQSVEVNLTSATLRITIDVKDDCTNEQVTSVLNEAYETVDEILPVKTYFTNQDDTKMYDLDIHVYNFIPEEGASEDGWVYKEKLKNASAKKPVTDTLSKARNKTEANELLKQQEELSGAK